MAPACQPGLPTALPFSSLGPHSRVGLLDLLQTATEPPVTSQDPRYAATRDTRPPKPGPAGGTATPHFGEDGARPLASASPAPPGLRLGFVVARPHKPSLDVLRKVAARQRASQWANTIPEWVHADLQSWFAVAKAGDTVSRASRFPCPRPARKRNRRKKMKNQHSGNRENKIIKVRQEKKNGNFDADETANGL